MLQVHRGSSAHVLADAAGVGDACDTLIPIPGALSRIIIVIPQHDGGRLLLLMMLLVIITWGR